MPRPRKVVTMSTRKISKKEKLDRKIKEEKLKLGRTALVDPPAYLPEEARAEYLRVVDEAAKVNILDNLDWSILAVYALNWYKFSDAEKHLLEDGYTIRNHNGSISPSPYIGISDKAAQMIMRCSTKLGLAATDRLKLVAPMKEEKPVNKYLEFISKDA